MAIKERVAIFVEPKYREMLNKIAEKNHRGQKQQIELLISEAHKGI